MRSNSLHNFAPAATVDYEEGRSRIKNGDVLMYRGRSLESRIIQWATRSRYSHAGLAVWWNNKKGWLKAK